MNKIARGVLLAGALMTGGSSLVACAYGGVAAAGDKVVVTRNDTFLFGMLRKIYVCDVADAGGLTNCVEGEAP